MRIPQMRCAIAGLVLSILAVGSALAAPSISSFSPASGTIGNHVAVFGSGFTGATAVTLNGVSAIFTFNSDTKITMVVPNLPSTGLIKVTVGGSTATSATNFTVTVGMALSFAVGHPTIKPSLYGAGFHPNTAVDVYFDNSNVALVVSTATGTLATQYQIPASAQPGAHWLTFVERGSSLAAQQAFTVQTNWTQEGFGTSGRGLNPFENTINATNVNTLVASWSAFAGGFSAASPFVVGGGGVFVGDQAGTIRAFSRTGALLWTAAPGSDLHSVNPAIALGRVFFGDLSGNVRSYNQACRSDGGVCTPLWTTNIGAVVTSGLTYFNGILYVPGGDGSIHTLNPTTGVAGISIFGGDTAHGAVTTPVVFDANGSFYYGASAVLEYRTASGPFGFNGYGGNLSPIAVNGGSAFFTTSDGMLHAFGGPVGWDVTTSGSGCNAAPVSALGQIFAGGCSTVAAYSPKTGAVQWSIATNAISGISEANGVLYTCEGGALQAYNVNFGQALWTGGFCDSAPEVTDGNVFATFVRLDVYDFPTVVGNVRRAPSISSLRPNYSLRPQLSGTAVISTTAGVTKSE